MKLIKNEKGCFDLDLDDFIDFMPIIVIVLIVIAAIAIPMVISINSDKEVSGENETVVEESYGEQRPSNTETEEVVNSDITAKSVSLKIVYRKDLTPDELEFYRVNTYSIDSLVAEYKTLRTKTKDIFSDE